MKYAFEGFRSEMKTQKATCLSLQKLESHSNANANKACATSSANADEATQVQLNI